MLVVIDEVDRLRGEAEHVALADLVKNVSDDLVPATLVLVGVAQTVSALISGHESIVRNLREVRMPRMTEDELRAIVEKGWEEYRVKSGDDRRFTTRATQMIVTMSQGFAYYVHLLAGAAAATAIRGGDWDVGSEAVADSMLEAVDATSQVMRERYADAIAARAGARLEPTLVACALTATDDLGYFAPSSVIAPLQRILGRLVTTGDFAHHLKRFADGRDGILEERRRGSRRVGYRFRDPLTKPFVLMNALENGLWGTAGPRSSRERGASYPEDRAAASRGAVDAPVDVPGRPT